MVSYGTGIRWKSVNWNLQHQKHFFIVFLNPKTHNARWMKPTIPSGVVGAGSLWPTTYINFLVWLWVDTFISPQVLRFVGKMSVKLINKSNGWNSCGVGTWNMELLGHSVIPLGCRILNNWPSGDLVLRVFN